MIAALLIFTFLALTLFFSWRHERRRHSDPWTELARIARREKATGSQPAAPRQRQVSWRSPATHNDTP